MSRVFTIWKFELEITDKQVVKLPVEHQILSVGSNPDLPQEPQGRLALWAMVKRPDSPDWRDQPETTTDVTLRVFGTGAELPQEGDMSHLATVVLGPGVWHVFRDHSEESEEVAGAGVEQIHTLGGAPMGTKAASQ